MLSAPTASSLRSVIDDALSSYSPLACRAYTTTSPHWLLVAHVDVRPVLRTRWSTTTRVFKNLKLLEGVEVALASENSKFSLANSHLPNPLASGDLIVRDHLPTERAMIVVKAMRSHVTLADPMHAKMSKAHIASRPTDTSSTT